MQRKYCSIPVTVTKAWTVNGRKHIAGVASDDKLDWYIERFSLEALNDMVMASKQKKALKPEEGLVDLLETHRETFGFGYVIDGKLERNLENNSTEYRFEAELKEGWPQGEELYKDIAERKIDKQLSVGGYIPDWENDYEYVEDTFVNEEGDAVAITVGVIKRFVLEHIAITPPDGAANPRTRFESAKGKVGFEQGAVYKSANDENYQKRFVHKNEGQELDSKEYWTKFKSLMNEIVLDVFGERGEQMTKLEKAKKMAEDYRKYIEDNKEDFSDVEVMKGLNISFVKEEVETPAVVGMTSESVAEIVKSRVEELIVEIDNRIEVVKGLIPILPEMPVIPEDKTVEIESLKAKLEAFEVRLKAIEDEEVVSKDETVVVTTVVEEVVEEVEELPPSLKVWN
jgi:hypothetical protein